MMPQGGMMPPMGMPHMVMPGGMPPGQIPGQLPPPMAGIIFRAFSAKLEQYKLLTICFFPFIMSVLHFLKHIPDNDY
jgi:hypothetical protein